GSVAASSRPASGTPVHPSPPQDLRSQEQPIAEIRRAAQSITAAEVKAHADYLGSDALMGRATPSPGQDSAAAYIIRELERIGLEPFGDDGSWLQRYRLTRTTLDTLATRGSLRGGDIRYGRDFVLTNFLRRGELSGGVVYVGSGIRAP